MRILQVINSLGTGGAEKLLLEAIPEYKKRGITVDLLLLDGTNHPFLERLREQNCCHVYVMGKGKVYSPWHIFRIIPHFKNYDLVHVHLFPSLYWTAIAKWASFRKIPMVYTEHNTSNRRRSRPLFKLLDRFIYKRYAKLVTIAQEVDKNLKEHLGFNEDAFQLIHNGINIKTIWEAAPSSPEEFGLDENDHIILQVSSFTPQKDQKTLIKALAQLPKNTRLLLVGTGPTLEECQQYASELGVENNVHFLGVRMDVPNLLKMADIVVLSSNFEGLSLSSIEGLASGKPFVASDVPGLTDVVEGAGILFPAGDSEALAICIQDLLNNSNHYKETVASCLERAKQYSLQNYVTNHLSLYSEIIEP